MSSSITSVERLYFKGTFHHVLNVGVKFFIQCLLQSKERQLVVSYSWTHIKVCAVYQSDLSLKSFFCAVLHSLCGLLSARLQPHHSQTWKVYSKNWILEKGAEI